jgi:hypothetical protein
MKSGFERMISDYPDPWNVNNFAKFACIAGDGATLFRLTERIGDRPIMAAWQSAEYYGQCVSYAKQFSPRP